MGVSKLHEWRSITFYRPSGKPRWASSIQHFIVKDQPVASDDLLRVAALSECESVSHGPQPRVAALSSRGDTIDSVRVTARSYCKIR